MAAARHALWLDGSVALPLKALLDEAIRQAIGAQAGGLDVIIARLVPDAEDGTRAAVCSRTSSLQDPSGGFDRFAEALARMYGLTTGMCARLHQPLFPVRILFEGPIVRSPPGPGPRHLPEYQHPEPGVALVHEEPLSSLTSGSPAAPGPSLLPLAGVTYSCLYVPPGCGGAGQEEAAVAGLSARGIPRPPVILPVSGPDPGTGAQPGEAPLRDLFRLDWAPAWSRCQQRVGCGGAFDHLHAGHRVLLTMAWLSADATSLVGVTDDNMIRHKADVEHAQSAAERRRGVASLLAALTLLGRSRPGDRATTAPPSWAVVPISEPLGPTRDDPLLTALVVSRETASGGQMINDVRAAAGLSILRVFTVPLVPGEGPDDKVSSTYLRRVLAQAAAAAEARGTAAPAGPPSGPLASPAPAAGARPSAPDRL
ncbi:hypothetical protein H696_00798 [Fonticula alba]|uniref:Cytidyltransferase-like domain-containing protein n=1 Tax=Fonticula alba TaxID=691883 RepID=A0A058ZIA8_FONAL|nr:hypothetical protein H696_00798 [Fonticula alba]KCV73257.1 hypothetical protein H696_00798 [Fonticula alba]|eukprot:XP_009492958.1 hypothetical protein H696_00798 [Fonticula alba]